MSRPMAFVAIEWLRLLRLRNRRSQRCKILKDDHRRILGLPVAVVQQRFRLRRHDRDHRRVR